MGYRIEADQAGVVDAVRKYGALQVNGYTFRLTEDGRAISDPVPDGDLGLFDVPGYFLVREEPPYERVSVLGGEVLKQELDEALRKGTANLEGLEGLKLEELPKSELLNLARQKGLTVSDRTTKQELITLLRGE
jgi:hypothetical protein